VLLIHKKFCQAKMNPISKKLKMYLFDFFSLKKHKIVFWESLKIRVFSKNLFLAFSVDKNSIFQHNPNVSNPPT